MAENKKSFLLYADLIHTVKKMPKGKQAELFMAILEYVNDKNPVVEDLIVSLVWEPVKLQLKRDLVKYETFRSKQIENGKKGGRPQVKNETQINPNNPSLYLETQKSLTVNDTVNVNDNVIYNQPEIIFPIEHCLTVSLNDKRWVDANKTNKQELEEFNSMLERLSRYNENPKEYKEYFSRWKAKGKIEDTTQPRKMKLVI